MPAKDLIGLAVAGAHASSKLDVASTVTKLEVASTLAKLQQAASLAEAATTTRVKTIPYDQRNHKWYKGLNLSGLKN